MSAAAPDHVIFESAALKDLRATRLDLFRGDGRGEPAIDHTLHRAWYDVRRARSGF